MKVAVDPGTRCWPSSELPELVSAVSLSNDTCRHCLCRHSLLIYDVVDTALSEIYELNINLNVYQNKYRCPCVSTESGYENSFYGEVEVQLRTFLTFGTRSR